MFSRVRRCCGACGLGKRRDRPCVADAPRKTPILNPYRVFFCICLRKRKRGFLQKGPALPAPVPVSPWPVSPWPDALRPLASCGYLSRGWLHLGFFPGCFGAFFLLWFSSMGRRLDYHGNGSLHRFLGCPQTAFERGRPWIAASFAVSKALSANRAAKPIRVCSQAPRAGRPSGLQEKPGSRQWESGRDSRLPAAATPKDAPRASPKNFGNVGFARAGRTATRERSLPPAGRGSAVFFIFTFFFGRFMVY